MKKFENVSIFIYALTESELLKKTVDVLLETCNHEDIREIVIVLSKELSIPECVNTADELAQRDSDVEIKTFYQKRKTLGGAILDSFDIMQGSHYLSMEADFGTDPYSVHKFIETAKLHPDKIVSASRWKKGGSFEGYGRLRMVVNKAFQIVMSIMFLSGVTDYSYFFQIIPKNVVQSINWDEPSRETIMEMTLKPLRLGVKFEEIPVSWKKRTEGETTQPYGKNIHYFYKAVKIRFTKKKDIKI